MAAVRGDKITRLTRRARTGPGHLLGVVGGGYKGGFGGEKNRDGVIDGLFPQDGGDRDRFSIDAGSTYHIR